MIPSKIYPGHVFTAPHLDIDTGKLVSHLFVCVYTQELDTSIPEGMKNNLKGLLISRRYSDIRYVVPLPYRTYKFLREDSYCYADKDYTFNTDSVQVVGSINGKDFADIVYALDGIQYSQIFQCVRALENISKGERNKLATFSSLLTERRKNREL